MTYTGKLYGGVHKIWTGWLVKKYNLIARAVNKGTNYLDHVGVLTPNYLLEYVFDTENKSEKKQL